MLGGDGTIRGTGASAISSTPLDGNGDLIEHGGIKQGDTVALTMRIDPELLRDGDRFAPSGWSVEDRRGDHHQDEFTADQSRSFVAVNAFHVGEAQ